VSLVTPHTDVTDAAIIRERRLERVKNADRVTFGFARFWLLLLFAIPLLIVFSYHLFGWKAAVSVFPLLLATSWLSRRSKHGQRPARSHPKYVTILVWAAACGIPLISIATSNPEFMRLWALAAGVLLFAAFPHHEPAVRTQAESISAGSHRALTKFFWSAAPGVMYVAGSETVWHFWTLGAWIWYHAFFLQVFVAFWVFVQWLRRAAGDETAPQGDTIIQSKPPNARSKTQGERHTAFVLQANSTWLEYKKITLGQARRLFEGLDLESSDPTENQANKQPKDGGWRAFNVDFDGFTTLHIGNAIPEVQSSFYVEWKHSLPNPVWTLKLPLKFLKAKSVPAALIAELIELGWREDWEGLAKRLEPFTNSDPTAPQSP
jgi:hypothetical protein